MAKPDGFTASSHSNTLVESWISRPRAWRLYSIAWKRFPLCPRRCQVSYPTDTTPTLAIAVLTLAQSRIRKGIEVSLCEAFSLSLYLHFIRSWDVLQSQIRGGQQKAVRSLEMVNQTNGFLSSARWKVSLRDGHDNQCIHGVVASDQGGDEASTASAQVAGALDPSTVIVNLNSCHELVRFDFSPTRWSLEIGKTPEIMLLTFETCWDYR